MQTRGSRIHWGGSTSSGRKYLLQVAQILSEEPSPPDSTTKEIPRELARLCGLNTGERDENEVSLVSSPSPSESSSGSSASASGSAITGAVAEARTPAMYSPSGQSTSTSRTP